tara:strand:- start:437 stop:724 length:288 start_codon:yes stop_codon:yes gene_type:complete
LDPDTDALIAIGLDLGTVPERKPDLFTHSASPPILPGIGNQSINVSGVTGTSSLREQDNPMGFRPLRLNLSPETLSDGRLHLTGIPAAATGTPLR